MSSNRAYYYEFTMQGIDPQAACKFFDSRSTFYGFNWDIVHQSIEGYVQFPTNRLFPYNRHTTSYTSQTLADYVAPTTPWQFTKGTLRLPKPRLSPDTSSRYELFIEKLNQEAAAQAITRLAAKRKRESARSESKTKCRVINNFVQKFSRESDLSIKGSTPPVEYSPPQ